MRKLLSQVLVCLGLCVSGSAGATLIDRGGGMIYDDVLNITWLQDANYAYTSGFLANNPNGGSAMDWNTANSWAQGLDYGGITGWRLPYISVAVGAGSVSDGVPGVPVDCLHATQLACEDNEYGYMLLYNLNGPIGSFTLAVSGGDVVSSSGVTIDNIQVGGYWTATSSGDQFAWFYSYGNGGQGANGKPDGDNAWAVHDGDVAASLGSSAVPEPATLALLGLGLAAIGCGRRKKH